MPDSMYDKLGELLSEALESGIFFTQNQENQNKDFKENLNDNKTNKKDSLDTKDVSDSSFYCNPDKNNTLQNQKRIKYVNLKVQKACAIVGIQDGMTFEEAKKVFRKKLLRFHPDKNADNEVMYKITKQKTEELLTSWKLIEEWFKS